MNKTDLDGPSDMSASLGERLRVQEAERKRLGPLAAREREMLTPEQFVANEQQIRSLFDQAQTNVMRAVAYNRTVELVTWLGWGPFIIGEKTPSDPKHPYHHIYRDAAAWGRENGLALRLNYQHDGGGIRSWYEISYIPEEN